jgi:O-antigen/teichoic acid export membrane protein
MWSSVLFIGFFGSSADVAILSVSQRVSLLISFGLIAINSAAAPKFAEAKAAGDLAKIRSISIVSIRLTLAFGLPVLVSVVIFPDFVLSVFGDEVNSGALALQIFCVGQLVNILCGPVGILLSMADKEKEYRMMLFSGAITVVLTGLILVPTFGVVGGAISTAAALAVQNVVGALLVKKSFGFSVLRIFN